MFNKAQRVAFMEKRRAAFMEKIGEAVKSVLPIGAIVLLLCFSIVPVPNSILMAFVIGGLLLILGMGLFTMGADMAMTPIGENVGGAITRTRKLWLILLTGFIAGVIITISEPDLQVLAEQVPNIPNGIIIGAVALGVGLFLLLALLRILLQVPLKFLLLGFYALVFILAQFVPLNFLSVAFDAGGVTTGPMTVPFIMALGYGIASMRSDSRAEEDSFGLVALCSIGPILAVLIMGMVYRTEGSAYTPVEIPEVADTQVLWQMFMSSFPKYFREVAISLLPVILFFIFFQIRYIRLNRYNLVKIGVGLLYTYLGLALFLTGVNVGFMPLGNLIGQKIGAMQANWIIVPLGMIIGYFIVAAEPAVHVLNRQVAEITAGAIPQRALQISLSVGVSISVGLSMLRVLLRLPILYILLPGYILALALSFFVPPVFTAIAFDSGGVASGPMTATFLLPLAMGLCSAVGGNVTVDAFGVVAMVAMTPLITIQLLGLAYKIKVKDR